MAVYYNEAADKLAGAGAQMDAVEDIIVHVSGAMTNLMICMRGNRRYVSHSVRAEGFRQTQVRLSGLGQQGVAAVLRRSIGGEYNYYSYTESVWGVPAVCRFRQVLFGDLLTGKERRAHGKVKSGISGVVRVQVHHR